MAQVRLQSISCQFSGVTAVEDITFDIPDHEFWVLVGPSGCGKSTILRAIAGLKSISSGQLYIGERLVNDIPARQRDVAMVFQNYALYPHFSVAENLAFGLKMRRQSSQTISRRVQEVARSLDIEHLLKRKPKQLSGGQQQRVALGRAIARQPQVFLLDEPLSNLDAQLRDDTRAELKQLHQKVGITTVYVTHDQVEAMTLADRVVVLNDGRVQQIDSPQAIYARPLNSMVAGFLGNPPMNILAATYQNDRLIIFNSQSIAVDAAFKQKLTMTVTKYDPRRLKQFEIGIRPEHIMILPNPESAREVANYLVLEVDLVEPLGRETLVKAIAADSQSRINLLTHAAWHGTVGDRIRVQFDLEEIFIFDAVSGRTLSPL